MAEDPKLWVALVTGGLALAGAVYTTIMSQRGRREQDRFRAKTDEALARLNDDLQTKRDARVAAAEAERVIARFRDPLMHAAYDLQSRIYNILKQDFLGRYYARGSPLEKDYAVQNTVFLVAQFLGWTELIRQEVQFLDLGSDVRTRELRTLQDSIYTQLQSDKLGSHFRLFAGEQRAIGELMVDRLSAPAPPRCIGYAAFLQGRPSGLDDWLDPLRENVRQISRDPSQSLPRLVAVQHSLIDMLQFLDPDFVRFPRACRTRV
jgi:hypothetical protein